MPINFQAVDNAETYSGRAIDAGWSAAMRTIVDPAGKRVADIGCGGGLYSMAWAEMGAAVAGVDFSPGMARTAERSTAGHPRISIRTGSADATGLLANTFDVVFERALIHHLASLEPAFCEAWRILRHGGKLIVQDRTMDDVTAPASPNHIRGHFFAIFPRLLAVESDRRPQAAAVLSAMHACGFRDFHSFQLWETRKIHPGVAELAQDLRERKGRSLLHELDDDELDYLIEAVIRELPEQGCITERDRWTLWTAAKHG